MANLSRIPLLLASLPFFVACSAASRADVDEEDETTHTGTSAPIVSGTTASAYPEAVLVDMYMGSSYPNAICSGSLIAPRVVLTAGHCVEGVSKWRIKAPFAGNQSAYATSGATYDWGGVTGETVDPSRHDVGLVFLDSAITISAWPTLATSPLAEGAPIVNIGRIDDGVASSSALFVGPSATVRDGKRIGYPYAYYTTEIIQPGDSGGPDEVPGASPHRIVAVNSGAGGGTQVLARVDLVYGWIDAQVKAHGGWPSASSPEPAPSPAPSPEGCSANEKESNDGYTAPNALSGPTCGTLAGGDQDWFGFSVGSTPTSYDVRVKATGDAQVQMWKLVSGSYYRIANTTPTSITKTSNGAGSYVIVVWSPSGAAQSYTLSR